MIIFLQLSRQGDPYLSSLDARTLEFNVTRHEKVTYTQNHIIKVKDLVGHVASLQSTVVVKMAASHSKY